jgi:hypothetical protein
MLCSSTKSRTSTDRCSHKALAGLLFCGKHAKTRNKVMWIPPTLETDSATIIQKSWRGWSLRRCLSLAGDPLKRHDCHNEEELVTLEEKNRQDPLNFFSFVENGKRWWFGLDTIIKLMETETPKNPYTNEIISRDTRVRIYELRDLYWFRHMYNSPQTLHNKCIMLSHILEDQIFEKISYTRFEYMSRLTIVFFSSEMHKNLVARWRDKPSQKREKHLFLIESCVAKQYLDVNLDFLLFQLISSLLYMLRTTKNKFPLSFIIFGALQAM